jgi:hypothetical protein
MNKRSMQIGPRKTSIRPVRAMSGNSSSDALIGAWKLGDVQSPRETLPPGVDYGQTGRPRSAAAQNLRSRISARRRRRLTDKSREEPVLIDGYQNLEVDELSPNSGADDETAKDWSLSSRVN